MHLRVPPHHSNASLQHLRSSLWNDVKRFAENESRTEQQVVTKLLSCTKQEKNSSDDWQCYFGSLAFTVSWLVIQLPPDCTNHNRVIAAVRLIQKQSQPLENERQGTFICCMFDMFYYCLCTSPLQPAYSERDSVYTSNRQERPKREPPPEYRITTTPEEWTNLNSFFARLMSILTPGTSGLHLHEVAFFHVLRTDSTAIIADALEYDNEAELMKWILPAACCWMLYAGTLYRRVLWDPDGLFKPTSGRELINPGPRYSGKGLISMDRWNCWKNRLLELGQDANLDSDTKQWAIRASKTMIDVEIMIPSPRHEPLYPPGFMLNRPLSPAEKLPA